jgi:hypothetical protein
MHVYLTSALVGGEWGESAHGTHWIGGCVGPRSGLDDAKKRQFLTLPAASRILDLSLRTVDTVLHQRFQERFLIPPSCVVELCSYQPSLYRPPAGTENFQTRLHIQWIEETLSPVVKRPGHEADHSLPSSAEVTNTWICISTSPLVFMAWCLTL